MSRWTALRLDPLLFEGLRRWEVSVEFEPIRASDEGFDKALKGWHAWLRLARGLLVERQPNGEDREVASFCHVDVGTSWRRLLRARLHAEKTFTLYCDGQRVVLRRGERKELFPEELVKVPQEFEARIRDRWSADYEGAPLPP